MRARQRLLMNVSYGQISLPQDGTISRNPFFTMVHETHICQRLGHMDVRAAVGVVSQGFDMTLAHSSRQTIEVSPGIGVMCQILRSADK